MMRTAFKLAAATFLGGACLLVAPADAQADTRFNCDLKGTWIEAKEDWLFAANYVAKNGVDSFTGVVTNSKAGTTANVVGSASNGTWIIQLTHTDAAHKGWIYQLVGSGSKDPKTQLLTVKGSFALKKNGTPSGNGTFSLVGQCKAVK